MGECPADSMLQCSQGILPRQEGCEWIPLSWVRTSFILTCTRSIEEPLSLWVRPTLVSIVVSADHHGCGWHRLFVLPATVRLRAVDWRTETASPRQIRHRLAHWMAYLMPSFSMCISLASKYARSVVAGHDVCVAALDRHHHVHSGWHSSR